MGLLLFGAWQATSLPALTLSAKIKNSSYQGLLDKA